MSERTIEDTTVILIYLANLVINMNDWFRDVE